MLQDIKVSTSSHTQLVDVTEKIQQLVDESGIKNGVAILFVPHTTAAVTINENADPDVCHDMINGLNQLIPLKNDYRHLEGNSAAHIKCSLVGASEQVIIRGGRLLLGTWQGLYFCEFDGPRSRKLLVKLIDG